ncbi:hypothetical protein Poli38472_006834 [Pythium oligandrum]|uniref:DUF4246 domain-containing protein n=1 Tax=Pythium oligandrum TaxID=41045 RepID=A0A8K1C5H5_PYTOL|nr:hypothetical protein Poli38472_006834 [Pythium oligandrum]|eukprot:TMW56824.1 hypothetical protein Poli38472_006834 [Pythium oligandrum]
MEEIPKHLSKVLNYEGKASEPVRHDESLWIPSDVVIRPDGRVEFLSYIDNLHPVRYMQLYESIADVFTAFVPLFERVLTYVTGPWSSGSGLFGLHPLEAKLTTGEKVLKTLYPLRGVIQAVIAIEEVQIHPDSISLPDAPSDSWVRHSVHNNIVATGVYVLHCTNLSEASLNFRRMARRPMAPGIRQSEIDEELGAIRCLEGRGVVFPAYCGHKSTSPLQLLVPTKPGSMQVLVIHVLNPSQPVVSSAEVPPRQREWRFDEIITPIARRYALPEDVQKRLETMIPGGFTPEEAVQLRGRVVPSTWFG